MDFNIDSENIQISVKANNTGSNSTRIESGINASNSPQSDNVSGLFDLSSNNVIKYEIVLKLDDFYLINNIKLIGELDEVKINKIRFQNIKTGIWESAPYFNPDKKDILMKEDDSISIFCVGLTQLIKIEVHIGYDSFSNRTLAITDFEPNKLINNLQQDIYVTHNQNQSMQEVAKNEKNKKNIFYFLMPKSSNNNGQVNNYPSNSNNNMCLKLIKSLVEKISVFSQYIYSIPNSTYMLTLLNLENYFLHNELRDDYLCSLFLTATSMMQARLFIQAWELLYKLQLNLIESGSSVFIDLLLKQRSNKKLAATSTDLEDKFKVLTKLEVIKAICMFEHGHSHAFLNTLLNCSKLYFLHETDNFMASISWIKNAESSCDKYFIQTFLYNNGKRISEILLILLQDRSEVILVSALKILEFILDNCPLILGDQCSKFLKRIFRIGTIKSINSDIKSETCNEVDKFSKNFEEKSLFISKKLINKIASIDQNLSISKKNDTPQLITRQVNYTLDTFINNIDNMSGEMITLLATKSLPYLFETLKTDIDPITNINLLKLAKKIVEHLNSDLVDVLKNSKTGYNNLPEFIYNLCFLAYDSKLEVFKKEDPTFVNNKHHQKFEKSTKIEIFEKSEKGDLVSFIIEKIGEDSFLFMNKPEYLELLTYFSNSIKIGTDHLSLIASDNIKRTNLSYLYLNIHLIRQIFCHKYDIRRDVNRQFFGKINNQFVKTVGSLVRNLVDLETLSLSEKVYLPLFDIITETLFMFKESISTIVKIDFSKIFEKQYKSVFEFICKSGIYNENIHYFLKTLPLFDPISEESPIKPVVTGIFSAILENLSNCYNDDIFEIFSLFLEKLIFVVDSELIARVIETLVSKYNYKGTSFKKCSQIFFDLLLTNEKYLNTTVNHIESSINSYLNLYLQSNQNFKLCKEFHSELLEKLDLYRGLIEYISTKSTIDFERLEMLIGFKKHNPSLVSLLKCNDNMILEKINNITSQNYELLLKCFTLKESLDLALADLFTNLMSFALNIFLVIKSSDNNYVAFTENYKLASKISTYLDSICASSAFNNPINNLDLSNLPTMFCDAYITEEDVARLDANFIKIQLYDSLSKAIYPDYDQFNGIRTVSNDLLNFLESIVICYKDINEESKLNRFYEYFIPIVTRFLSSNDNYENIFSVEILLKFLAIKFSEPFDKDNKIPLSLNLPNVIWQRLFVLSEHKNYKISIFATYLIQLACPHEAISHILQDRENNLKSIKAELDVYDNSGYITINGDLFDKPFWMSEEELMMLHERIRDKIIFEFRTKNLEEKNEIDFPTFPSAQNDVHNLDNLISSKVDEINDDIDLIKVPDITEELVHTNINSLNRRVGNDPDTDLNLEELGVFEVEDEIFENFDEENIPVIKNIYKRKKGSAEKLKTNQNTRNLLMSEQNSNNSDRYKKSQNAFYEPYSHISGQNYLNEENKDNLDKMDEDLLPDLKSKKKNIRPLNGLRPATPPLKQVSHNKKVKNEISPKHRSSQGAINSVPLAYQNDFKRNHNRNNEVDKKYQIRSMEELFLDDDETAKDPQQVYYEKDYDEVVLNSFENINLEDFKKNSSGLPLKINVDQLVLDNINDYVLGDKLHNKYIGDICDLNNADVSDNNIYEEQKSYDTYNMDKFGSPGRESDVEFIESLTDSLPMGDGYVGEDVYDEPDLYHPEKKSKIEHFKENKSKRPPTRYGNRSDQIIEANSVKKTSPHIIEEIETRHHKKVSTNSMKHINNNHTLNLTNDRLNSPKIHNLSTVEPRYLENKYNEKLQKEEPMKISSDFRRTLKLKLSKNSNKIFKNLKKLSMHNRNSFTKREDLSRNSHYDDSEIGSYNMISTRTVQDNDNSYNRSQSNNNPRNNIRSLKEDMPKQAVKKKHNTYITTSLTESKYLGWF